MDEAAIMPRAALVTGAAQRIGRAISLALAADGWAVAVHYRASRAAADGLVAEIAGGGGQAVALAADLADESAVAGWCRAPWRRSARSAALVNNASSFENDTVATATRASWDEHIEVNLRAPLVLMQGFAAQLPEAASGAIINMLDQRVWSLTPYFVSYTVSKAALWTLTQSMALALAPRIRVNGIGPGPTLPARARARNNSHGNALRFRCGGAPARRRSPRRSVFILAAPAMTGQMIALDGGAASRLGPAGRGSAAGGVRSLRLAPRAM